MAAKKIDFEGQTAEIISRLDVLAEYKNMGVRFASDKPRSSGMIECYAVGRDERKPSSYINCNSGRYGDSATNEHMSIFDFAAKYGGHGPTWQDARKFFAAKAGIKLGNHKPPENPADLIEFVPWTPGEERLVERWCSKFKPGASLEAIKIAGGRVGRYPCHDSKGEKRDPEYKVIALPCWGPAGLNADPVAWVLWNVSGGPFRIFRGKDKPFDEVKMKSVGPTRGAMMNFQALSILAEGGDGVELIIKTGGPSDMLAAIARIPLDQRNRILVVTNASSETGDVLSNQVAWFAGHSVVVIHDCDDAGESGAVKWCGALDGVASEVRHARLPWSVAKKNGKDLRNYFQGVPV